MNPPEVTTTRNKVPANSINPMPTIPEEPAQPGLLDDPQLQWLSPGDERDLRSRFDRVRHEPRSFDIEKEDQQNVHNKNGPRIPAAKPKFLNFFKHKGHLREHLYLYQ